jgi:hypothetical protein
LEFFMLNFFQHVPLSALVVLVLLIWRGVRACHDRVLPVSRAILLPLVVLVLSVWNMPAMMREPVLAACWLLAAGASVAICQMLHYPTALMFEVGSRCVRVSGSPLVLVLMLVLYCAHFAEAAFNTIHPATGLPMVGRLALMLVYGSAGGIFLARLLGLIRAVAGWRPSRIEG